MHLLNGKIRDLRLERGWTQQHLADACGVSLRTIQRVEKDGTASLETTSALIAVFEIERQDILMISSPANSPPEIRTTSAITLVATAAIGMMVGVAATLVVLSF